MRLVFAATADRKISGALMCEYSTSAWCSTAQTASKPACSAYTACSTQLSTCCRSTSGVPYSTCASKIIENFMPVASRSPTASGIGRRGGDAVSGEIANVDQANAWNGLEGDAWTADQARYDVVVGAYHATLLAAAAIARDERVLDI